ncbi:GPGG-motif small membrane protein [Aeromicrobium endophyticum]|uniref:GPGG-motif small membrane protein n=1 Tax=Aeromicrobium endophyticum TaxID=2292704 RepID=UPI0018F61016|nr:GPGG-motif small membrane protein [Aeromicrobium endophyticum]
MGFLLWIIAVALVIYGVISLINGSILLGIILIVVGLAVGPGGWSIFNRRGSRA